MATRATVGYLNLAFQAYTGSPITYRTLEEVTDVSGLGVDSPLIDVTNFDSTPGTKEFVAGPAEGKEVTVTCNLTWQTYQLLLINYVDNKRSTSFKMTWTGVSPNRTKTFTAACAGYSFGPSLTAANSITFTLKISGAIT